MGSLKYVKGSISHLRITDWPDFPFLFSDIIRPIEARGVTLHPNMHSFDLCFAQMKESYPNTQEAVKHLDKGIDISSEGALIYLGINQDVFSRGSKLEKKITESESCMVPEIIDRFMRERGFKDLISRAKELRVTYGDETTGVPYHGINGIMLIMNDGKRGFNQDCISIYQANFLEKFFEARGAFIMGGIPKGLDYYLSAE